MNPRRALAGDNRKSVKVADLGEVTGSGHVAAMLPGARVGRRLTRKFLYR